MRMAPPTSAGLGAGSRLDLTRTAINVGPFSRPGRYNRNAIEFLKNIEPQRQHWILYEDLVTDPGATPHSTIWKISVDGGEPQHIHEENYWLGHFNCSPTLSHLLTFCHEGPWDKIDNRIWGLDLSTGKHWKIRPVQDYCEYIEYLKFRLGRG